MLNSMITGALTDATRTFRWSFCLAALAALLAAFFVFFPPGPSVSKKNDD